MLRSCCEARRGGSLPVALWGEVLPPLHSFSPFFRTLRFKDSLSHCKGTQLLLVSGKIDLHVTYIELHSVLPAREQWSCFHCKMRQSQIGEGVTKAMQANIALVFIQCVKNAVNNCV